MIISKSSKENDGDIIIINEKYLWIMNIQQGMILINDVANDVCKSSQEVGNEEKYCLNIFHLRS